MRKILSPRVEVKSVNPRCSPIEMFMEADPHCYDSAGGRILRVTQGPRLMLIEPADIPALIEALQKFAPSPLECLARAAV